MFIKWNDLSEDSDLEDLLVHKTELVNVEVMKTNFLVMVFHISGSYMAYEYSTTN